jgi:hypothetical protein
MPVTWQHREELASQRYYQLGGTDTSTELIDRCLHGIETRPNYLSLWRRFDLPSLKGFDQEVVENSLADVCF